MQNLAPLISDLALILIVAGVVTIIFKRLKQPLVLGYIVAGFLAGPHMPYTPSVEDSTSIHTWSEIGVIFLMFTLGLEFSFKKIVKMGFKPIMAAICVMFCMMSLGSGIGHLFGWSSMNSLFLGGMLAMSSTTIIYKAFDDLGLGNRKFAGEVLSVLILEDILGILLMVVLSALAVSREFQGLELAGSLFQLAFFLILWFIVGVFLVPLILKHNIRWMNKETLLVCTIGLCFLLVVCAANAGYSPAFGAFMMGSILAETVEAENIEHVVSPVKDLFGAIFFVSVGMMVDPSILVEYWMPICAITITILAGQVIFGSGSFLIAGHPLKIAMQCGFSLAQIGEFAFIIASLGVTLKVTDPFLYPVVVAVSIITTFLTPYMIRAAEPCSQFVEKRLPHRMKNALSNKEDKSSTKNTGPKIWKKLLISLTTQVGAYLTLSIAVIIICSGALLPFLRSILGIDFGSAVCALFIILITSPFLRAIVMRKNHSEEFKVLSKRKIIDRIGLAITFIVRFAIASSVVGYVIYHLMPEPEKMGKWAWCKFWLPPILAIVSVVLMILSKRIKMYSIQLERTFMHNLNSREQKAKNDKNQPGYAGRLQTHHLHIARLHLPQNSAWGGRQLCTLNFTNDNCVMIAAIIRGEHRINIPDGQTMIYPGDYIDVIGDDEHVTKFSHRMEAEVIEMAPNDPLHKLTLRRMLISENAPFINKNLVESGIRDVYHCMLVGFENNNDNSISIADSQQIIRQGDTIWLVGEESSVEHLIQLNQGVSSPA